MADTVRITRDPEYFPFMEGYKLVYHLTSTRFEGAVETVEIVMREVRAFREDATAVAAMTRLRMSQPTTGSYRIRKNAKSIFSEGGVLGLARQEYPQPVVVGKRWAEGVETSEIASMEATVEVPAGKFIRCLRVNTAFDGGSAIRYYAPGIGCVYEERSERDWAARVRLVSFELPGRRPA